MSLKSMSEFDTVSQTKTKPGRVLIYSGECSSTTDPYVSIGTIVVTDKEMLQYAWHPDTPILKVLLPEGSTLTDHGQYATINSLGREDDGRKRDYWYAEGIERVPIVETGGF
jgi:hypothetical protein